MDKYVVSLMSNNLYKEIQLPQEEEVYRIGTAIDCDYRLHKELFFEDLLLEFQQKNGMWTLSCSDNLFLSNGGSARYLNVELHHGDNYSLCYFGSSSEALMMNFSLDFEGNYDDLRRIVRLDERESISIGSASDCSIKLESPYLANDKIVILRKNNGFQLKIVKSSYGVRVNGNRIGTDTIVKNGDFISIGEFVFYLKDNKLWMMDTEKAIVNGFSYSNLPNRDQYPNFSRNTRVKTVLDQEEITILDPPAVPQKPKNNLLMSLLPSAGMLLSAGVMAASGGTSMLVFSGISAGMAIVTTFVGIGQNKKEYKENTEKRITEYQRYITEKKDKISEFRMNELERLRKIYTEPQKMDKMLESFSADLFDRERNDDDFMHVRLGKGMVEASRKIQYKKQEKLEVEDELQSLPEQICNEYKMIYEAPVVCDFKSCNAIGIIGDREFCYEIIKSNVYDICTRHFYTDVKLFFIVEEENKDRVSAFRFLPHVNGTLLNSRNIVCDEESKKVVFDYLFNELSSRETRKSDNKKEAELHYVIYLYDQCGFSNHPLSRFIKRASELGVTFVFCGDKKAEIPQGCEYFILQENEESKAKLVDSQNDSIEKTFTYHRITDDYMNRLSLLLAPVSAEEVSLEGSLTKSIDLFTALNIFGVEDLDLQERWSRSRVYESMAAPLGVSRSGAVWLDLHDKAHGPHGLVAGTTGSGKSEILQSYILSVATYFHPYEVAFLIIDFKGGGMANQFKKLPHMLGAITNIDGKQIQRSLKSIKAELQKRQRYFAQADVNHIDKYIKKFKAGEVNQPLPHLIIIVDEFAELKAEQPDFMKELISAARIGRSLGVHLILATQKPSGQVDDQIWSNSRFKLCLKVQDTSDSNEVLKSPLAAEIKEPGRAYLQVGNNEIFELFQSAYSGAPESGNEDHSKEFTIYSLSESGKRTAIYSKKHKKTNGNTRSQLEALVEYINDYTNQKHIAKLPDICMAPLTDMVLQPNEMEKKNAMVDIGIYDDPDNQIQEATYLDIDNKHTLIIGSAQCGKTNFVESLIKSISYTTSPKQSNIYIIDFGSMVLKNFEKLNHVGGVVTPTEDEKLKNLFKLLLEENARRKEVMLEVGVSSFATYLEAGYTDLPHIYLFIENMTALSELYLQEDDSLLQIMREGISVGISVIVTNSQIAGIGYRYLSNFANKIAFHCNDSGEYMSLFDHSVMKPDEIPGRCILEVEKRILECQTYLAFEGEKEIDRVNRMREYIMTMNERYANEKAVKIPYIPKVLTTQIMEDEYHAFPKEAYIPIGLTYEEVKPFYLNLNTVGMFGISGKTGFGHKNFVRNIIHKINGEGAVGANIVIIDDVTKKYADCSDSVAYYTMNADDVCDVIREWHQELKRRYQNVYLGAGTEDNDLLLLIVQNNDVATVIQDDSEISDMFQEILSRYKDMGVCIIFANYPNKSISYDAPDILRTISQNQHILCLEDLRNVKCVDVSYEASRMYKKPLTMGDGYYMLNGEVVKLKLVKAE